MSDAAVDRIEPSPAGSADPGRWLTPDQLEAWLALGALSMRLPGALDAQLQRDAGINNFEYLVLAMLSEAPERTRRMSQLAYLSNGSLSRLSHVVSRLERRGWVRREPCPHDGRATNAVLTDQGYAKVAHTAPGHVAWVRTLVVDALDAEQLAQLGRIAGALLARIDEVHGMSMFPSAGRGADAALPDRDGGPA